jgi:serine/threonine-protein kinase
MGVSPVTLPAKLKFQPGDTVIGKYQIEAVLGAGQHGEVYRVFNKALGQMSALKVISVEDPARHKAGVEAQAHALCQHDHVVKILTADVFDGAVFIEMELIDGQSLEDRLFAGFIPVIETISYLKDILFALEHAHARGIIHRDVKPGNIMLRAGRAKLSDFGVALHPETGLSPSGHSHFYLPHASPEAYNDNSFSASSDVFSSGLTLLRAVNNMPDWRSSLGGKDWRVLVGHGKLAEQIGVAAYVPRTLKSIINKALSPHADHRYDSATKFREALQRLRPARAWIRESEDLWSCSFKGKAETVRYLQNTNSVDYLISGRRQSFESKTFDTELQARTYMAKLVGDLTFLNTMAKRARFACPSYCRRR